VLHQHHDEVFKPVLTSFPWASLLYDLAGVLPERVDFVATLRRVGVIIVFLRSIPHESGSNVRYANGVGDSQARRHRTPEFLVLEVVLLGRDDVGEHSRMLVSIG
jgi:hypothetical protein